MAKRQFYLTSEELTSFRQAEGQTRNTHELRHLQGVRLYGSGASLSTILDVLGCGESSLRDWVSTYKRKGIAGLRPGWDGTNANKLSGEQRADLKRRLHQSSPDQVLPLGERVHTGSFWSIEDLGLAVRLWYGVTYKDKGSLRHLFKQAGFSYHKVEAVYKSQPSVVAMADFEAELEKK